MSFDPTSTMLELMSDKQLLTVFKRVAERRSANLTELSGSDSIDDTANQMQTLLTGTSATTRFEDQINQTSPLWRSDSRRQSEACAPRAAGRAC